MKSNIPEKELRSLQLRGSIRYARIRNNWTRVKFLQEKLEKHER